MLDGWFGRAWNLGHRIRWRWIGSYRQEVLQGFLGRDRAAMDAWHRLAMRHMLDQGRGPLDDVSYKVILQAAYGSRLWEGGQMVQPTEKAAVPARILIGIKAVRDSVRTNMFDTRGVAQAGYLRGYPELGPWIEANQETYVQGVFNGYTVAVPAPDKLGRDLLTLQEAAHERFAHYAADPVAYWQLKAGALPVDEALGEANMLLCNWCDGGAGGDYGGIIAHLEAARPYLTEHAAAMDAGEEVEGLYRLLDHLKQQRMDGAAVVAE